MVGVPRERAESQKAVSALWGFGQEVGKRIANMRLRVLATAPMWDDELIKGIVGRVAV